MPLGRPSKPLFDLLPRGDAARAASQSTARPVVIEHKPLPRQSPAPGQGPLRPSQAPAGLTPQPESDAGSPERQFTIPMNAVYVGVTALFLLVIATWIFGVKAGRKDTERRLGQRLAQDDPGTLAPGELQIDPDPPSAGAQDERQSSPPPAPAPESTQGRFYAAGGWTDADPREKGMNYLHLPLLRREDAVRAVRYLGTNRVAAAAVPSETVDRGAAGDKNVPLYHVVVLQGLTREQYSDGGTRSRLEQTVRGLGAKWKKDERGPSDFSSMSWVKFGR